ncbi:MAG TPA: CDP-alcohol phosphatidyltransferase family protein [Candidatus Saccharimonadales bacterium]
MLSPLKPVVEKGLKPIARPLSSVNPNIITLFGLIFPIVFFVLLLHKVYAWALLVFVFNGVDMLDGMIAREQHKVTAFGGFLDSTVDRFADFAVIVAFGFADIVKWGVVLTLVLLSYLISYIRSRTELAAKGNLVANVGIMERTERLLAIFLGLALYALWPHARLFGQNIMTLAYGVLIVLSAITVAQRVRFAYKHL